MRVVAMLTCVKWFASWAAVQPSLWRPLVVCETGGVLGDDHLPAVALAWKPDGEREECGFFFFLEGQLEQSRGGKHETSMVVDGHWEWAPLLANGNAGIFNFSSLVGVCQLLVYSVFGDMA
ncbi:hypothetical protein BJY04DRAFT_110206 [Aspergillus karnatakaensis]|uniref:uncharacterized protein n=1 Tax=Aspergillus karnatakaensis TaxID=1810916 RepID=UPI003CCDBB70